MESTRPELPGQEGQTSAKVIVADSVLESVRDYSLLALVQENDVSVRLRNSIVSAVTLGTLPFETVGNYIDAGAQAENMILRVRNLGRKSARELDALVKMVFATGEKPKMSSAADRLEAQRQEFLALFSGDQLGALVRDELLSARLSHVLTQPPLSQMSFAQVVDSFHATTADLFRRPNCGRRSVDEFKSFCTRHIRMRLRDAGYANPEPIISFLLADRRQQGTATLMSVGRGDIDDVPTAEIPTSAHPEHKTLSERLDWLLTELDPRALQVLRRRYGIGQSERETLEEIGAALSVTRERIRQIESKSLRRIRVRARRVPVRLLLLAEGANEWDAFTNGALSLKRADLHERRRAIGSYVRLACDIEELSLECWLNEVAHPLPFGWLSPREDPAAVIAAATQLEALDEVQLPYPLVQLIPTSTTLSSAIIAAELIRGCNLRHGYLMPPRVGARLTRLVRLHALLAGYNQMSRLEQLVRSYRAIFADDPCSERDAEIVMDAAPHLFLEIGEGCWIAIGAAGTSLPVAPDETPSQEPHLEEPGTIAHALQTTLAERGPTRLSELLEDAERILPDGRSINSIGPVLLTRRELFVRALPGVYALPEQVEVFASAMPEGWPIFFNDAQARYYALARYAGEEREIFPLWSAPAEYALCQWARHSGGAGIFSSLLAIANVDEWPIATQEIEVWQRLQSQEGRYTLGVGLRHSTAYELPALDRLFAACRYAVASGQFSWSVANRLIGRKIDSHSGAGLVALMIRLGALEEISTEGFRWQRPHRATDFAAVLVRRFEDAFSRAREPMNWASSLGREIANRVTQGPHEIESWVDEAAVADMFTPSREAAMPDIEDDPLAQLLARQKRLREAARRDATLDWLLAE